MQKGNVCKKYNIDNWSQYKTYLHLEVKRLWQSLSCFLVEEKTAFLDALVLQKREL